MATKYILEPKDAGQRLDVFCVGQLPLLSRAAIQKAIKVGNITVNGKVVKPRQILKAGDEVHLNISQEVAAPIPDVAPENIPVLYEDKDVVVINKPAGVEVHTGMAKGQPTVTAWFRNRYPDAKNVGEAAQGLSVATDRPGVVHRLDKDTSGAMILAKTNAALLHLKKQFKTRRVKKEYLALVFGVPNMKKGRITRPISRTPRNPLRRTTDDSGKPAITEWQREKKIQKKTLAPHQAGAPGSGFALLRLFPFTGRTHQLRVHLHFLGHPIVGDKLYTFKRQRPPEGIKRQLLHAEKLTLMLPTGKIKTFIAPLPDDFERAINP